ncbi:oxidoreductase [Polaromonas sp.]|uniref:oxidoreductase n=1 Tax=Polaromonas sp. TaxID=1869339 RepID=UPI0032654F33
MSLQSAPSHAPLHVALIGYGFAGKTFHAPLIAGVPGLQLSCVSSSKPAQVLADWPQVRVVAEPGAAFADPAIDVVVIATSNTSHHPLAKAALLARKHVVIDKPCTVTLAETEELLALAHTQQRVLTVFQNRRWDADFLALQQVLAQGVLGRIVHFESHFDRYRPEVPDRWRDQALPGSGLWLDLGAHLADQCLQLFGCPDDLLLDLAQQRDGARTNDWFHAQLRYGSTHPGLRVILHGSALVPVRGPRFVVHGTQGSFINYGLDTQEDTLKTGRRPSLDSLGDWGRDPLPAEVLVYRDGQALPLPAPETTGNYLTFYAQLRDHLQGRAAVPVTAAQVHQAMGLLVLGEQSAREGRFLSAAHLLAVVAPAVFYPIPDR